MVRRWSRVFQKHGVVWGLVAMLGTAWLAGCGGGAKPAPVGTGEVEKTPAANTSSEETKQAAPKTASTKNTATKQPMIGDIPLDVWFEDPIGESQKKGAAPVAVAQANTPAATKTDTPMPAEKPEEKPAETPADSTGGSGAGDWDSMLTAEDVQEEVKKIRLELKDSLSSITKYNAHYKEIAQDAAVLSALAIVAPKLKDKVSWKDVAPNVRDIGAEMGSKAKGLGQKPYDETKKEFEKIDELLSGNKPAGLEEAAPEVPFSEVVSRRALMQRFEAASGTLRGNFATEDQLKKGGADAARLASVMAMLFKVISDESYPNADEEDYQKMTKSLLDMNLAIAKAARDGDHAAYASSNGTVGKVCGDCHQAYQNAQ